MIARELLAAASTLAFFTGIHQPGDAKHFDLVCLSINRIEKRVKPLPATVRVFGDSAGFTTIDTHGGYPEEPEVYAAKIHRLQSTGVVNFAVVATQDYMCEPFMLAKTGLTILDHQRLTVERYDRILAELLRLYGVTDQSELPFEFLPVLQGWTPEDYVRHVEMYGERLRPGMWVGVGSVCKRQGRVSLVEDVLGAIKEVRPDLRLHGFRREDHRVAERARAAAAVQRRQHGLELRRAEGRQQDAEGPVGRARDHASEGQRPAIQEVAEGFPPRGQGDLRLAETTSARPEQLARGRGVRRPGRRWPVGARATEPLRHPLGRVTGNLPQYGVAA